jgi:galactose-1-phosphate uridylyltransferase
MLSKTYKKYKYIIFFKNGILPVQCNVIHIHDSIIVLSVSPNEWIQIIIPLQLYAFPLILIPIIL